jgi:hypothetical protein
MNEHRPVNSINRSPQAMRKIKIAHQQQANKPIYLLQTGAIECGNFRYDGRYKKRFKLLFEEITGLAYTKLKDGVLDVSQYKYWDAIRIYDDYILPKWLKSISAKKVEELAAETQVVLMLEDINHEFNRAVALKWRRIFHQSDPNNANTPKLAWQIL